MAGSKPADEQSKATLLNLNLETDPALPRLGWVARIDVSAGHVQILAGRDVEAGDNWLVEGVWPGPFGGAGFAASESFFGSGLVVESNAVVLVPSCSLTDRVWLASPAGSGNTGHTVASNSLLLLLGALGGRLDEDMDYRPACHAILAGVDEYDASWPGSFGQFRIEQLYLHPVRLSADGPTRVPRDHTASFDSFETYEACLSDVMGGIARNCADSLRRVDVKSVTATSTGYDSAAVSALARDHGVEHAWATDGAVTLDGDALEDATGVTMALSLETSVLQPLRPSAPIERLCLAATFDGRESIFTSMFESCLASGAATCLFSGYHGDKVWDRATTGANLDRAIRRGDTSGVNLSEVRLHCGLYNVSIPFVQARSIARIVAIANSADMAPWQLGTDYDRPVPRRIAESRGVPREMFGVGKTQVMEYYTWPRDPELRDALFQYLRGQGFGWLGRKSFQVAEQIDYRLAQRGRSLNRDARERLRPGARNLDNTVFLWAVNSAVDAQRQSSEPLRRLLTPA